MPVVRTTITIPDDVFDFTSTYAHAKGLTLSSAIAELLRRAERTAEPEPSQPKLKKSKHGYLVIAGTGRPITSEMVKEYSEDPIG